jgi:hypothetical protein
MIGLKLDHRWYLIVIMVLFDDYYIKSNDVKEKKEAINYSIIALVIPF